MPAKKMVSDVQWVILLSYMERKPDFATSNYSLNPLGSYKKESRWVKLARLLNEAEGCKKTLAQWKEYWTSLKYKARQKIRENKKTKASEEYTPNRQINITDRDRRLLNLIGEGKDNPDTIDTTTGNIPKSSEYCNDSQTLSDQSTSVAQFIQLNTENQRDRSLPTALTPDLSGTVLSKPEIDNYRGHIIKVRRILKDPEAGASSSQATKVKTDEQLPGSTEKHDPRDDSRCSLRPSDYLEMKMEVKMEKIEDSLEKSYLPASEKVTLAVKLPSKIIDSIPNKPSQEPQKPPEASEERKQAQKRTLSHAQRFRLLEKRKMALEERKLVITEKKVAVAQRTARSLEGILEEISGIKTILKVRLRDTH